MERDDRMTDAAATPPDSGGGDAGAWLVLYPESIKGLTDCPEDFTAVLFPLCRWFMGLPFDRPRGLAGTVFDMMQANQMRNLALRELKRKGGQARSERKADAARANGCKGGRPRKIENPTKPNRNPTETHNENETKPNETILNENETRSDAPQPFCFPDDSLTPPQLLADVGAMIDDAARTLGDCHPSRDKWRAFIQRNGGDAFRDAVKSVAEDMRNGKRIDRPGAYLNSRLDAYTPPPPPAPPPPPIEYGPRDWILCAERCRHYDAGPCKCSRGIDTPPEHDRPPRPPEECHAFARRDG